MDGLDLVETFAEVVGCFAEVMEEGAGAVDEFLIWDFHWGEEVPSAE